MGIHASVEPTPTHEEQVRARLARAEQEGEASPGGIIAEYLCKRMVCNSARLIPHHHSVTSTDLRASPRAGTTPAGDTFFKTSWHRADTANEEGQQRFYNMMLNFGVQIDAETDGAFHINNKRIADGQRPRILDLCMAPGGFGAKALELIPGHSCVGLRCCLGRVGIKRGFRTGRREKMSRLGFLISRCWLMRWGVGTAWMKRHWSPIPMTILSSTSAPSSPSRGNSSSPSAMGRSSARNPERNTDRVARRHD